MPKPTYKANPHPFEGMTTAKEDYKEWQDHIRETSFKPNLVSDIFHFQNIAWAGIHEGS